MLCIKIQLFGAFCVALGCLLWRFGLFLDPLLVLFFDWDVACANGHISTPSDFCCGFVMSVGCAASVCFASLDAVRSDVMARSCVIILGKLTHFGRTVNS